MCGPLKICKYNGLIMQESEEVIKSGKFSTPNTKRKPDCLTPPENSDTKKPKMAGTPPEKSQWDKFADHLMEKFKTDIFDKFSKDILARVDNLEAEIASNLPERISKVESELEKGLNFNSGETEKLDNRVTQLEKDNKLMEVRVNQLFEIAEHEIEQKKLLQSKVCELEDRQRRDNLIFEGIPDTQGETQKDCEKNTRKHLKDTLKVPGSDKLCIGRVHRLGKFKDGQNRQTIVKFDRFPDRQKVWSKGIEQPSNSQTKVRENFSQESEKARSKLYPIMKIARNKGYYSKLEGHKLIVRDTKGDKNNVNVTCTMDTLDQLPDDLDPAKLFTPVKDGVTLYYTIFSPHSSFYPCKFHEDGVKYNSLEQYIIHKNAIAINNHKLANKVLGVSDPTIMKAMAKGKFDKLDINVKMVNVKKGMLLKYGQNEDLQELLKDTLGTTLAESSPFDKVWGTGRRMTHKDAFSKNYEGKNLHGKLLMEVRSEFEPDWD